MVNTVVFPPGFQHYKSCDLFVMRIGSKICSEHFSSFEITTLASIYSSVLLLFPFRLSCQFHSPNAFDTSNKNLEK